MFFSSRTYSPESSKMAAHLAPQLIYIYFYHITFIIVASSIHRRLPHGSIDFPLYTYTYIYDITHTVHDAVEPATPSDILNHRTNTSSKSPMWRRAFCHHSEDRSLTRRRLVIHEKITIIIGDYFNYILNGLIRLICNYATIWLMQLKAFHYFLFNIILPQNSLFHYYFQQNFI